MPLILDILVVKETTCSIACGFNKPSIWIWIHHLISIYIHYITLHYITLHYITLHYITYLPTYIHIYILYIYIYCIYIIVYIYIRFKENIEIDTWNKHNPLVWARYLAIPSFCKAIWSSFALMDNSSLAWAQSTSLDFRWKSELRNGINLAPVDNLETDEIGWEVMDDGNYKTVE